MEGEGDILYMYKLGVYKGRGQTNWRYYARADSTELLLLIRMLNEQYRHYPDHVVVPKFHDDTSYTRAVEPSFPLVERVRCLDSSTSHTPEQTLVYEIERRVNNVPDPILCTHDHAVVAMYIRSQYPEGLSFPLDDAAFFETCADLHPRPARFGIPTKEYDSLVICVKMWSETVSD